MKNLLIVCNLDPQQLQQSIEFLQCFYQRHISENDLSINTLEEKDFLELKPSTDFKDYELLILHLRLDSEINSHRNISNHATRLNIKQLNPYNSLSELFDNKFKFYNFMLANGFKQAETQLIKKTAAAEFINRHANFILKPCSGTESIDQQEYEHSSMEQFYKHLQHIQSYDLAIIQEKINFINEYKIIFFKNYVMAAKELNQRILDYCKNFFQLIQNHTNLTQEFPVEIFSLDLLETEENDLISLEANARPAGIYKCSNFIYQLKT